MTINALYLCCIANPWISVAQNLEKVGIVPKYFVVWGKEEQRFESAFLDAEHIQTVESAWKGLGFPDEQRPAALDEAQLKELHLQVDNLKEGSKDINRKNAVSTTKFKGNNL